MPNAPRILVTGANGQLGRAVVARLREIAPASPIVAMVRTPSSVSALAGRDVEIRVADYDDRDALATVFRGVDRTLLISSSEVGRRTPQHRNVIEAARAAGVRLIGYTSILHGPASPLALAKEHIETEALLGAAAIPHVVLRNGWYTENYSGFIRAALQSGALVGGAGAGRISAASRADYAAAAAAVIASEEDQNGKIYELAGDDAFTLAELASELSRLSGASVDYRNLSAEDHCAALIGAGLPDPFAALLADSDAGAAKGGLFDDSRTLSRLIGRPTTPLAVVLAAALAG